MEGTIARFAYRYIIIPLDQNCSFCVLCSDSLQLEELQEFINFEISKNDFLLKLNEDPAIENYQNSPKNLVEWMLISENNNSLRKYCKNEKSFLLDAMHIQGEFAKLKEFNYLTVKKEKSQFFALFEKSDDSFEFIEDEAYKLLSVLQKTLI